MNIYILYKFSNICTVIKSVWSHRMNKTDQKVIYNHIIISYSISKCICLAQFNNTFCLNSYHDKYEYRSKAH